MGLKYSISAFVTTGLTCESWVKLGRNRLETEIKSIFHSPESTRTTLKKKVNEILKYLFVFELDPSFPYPITLELMGLLHSHEDNLSYF